MKTVNLRKIIELICSLVLAGVILYWLYKDFPFSQVSETLKRGVRWDWMAGSLLFGIIPQILRGVR